jgi:AmmeMemoRadiSam system protein B
METGIRRSVIAGSWYPGDAQVLKADIERFFSHVADKDAHGDIVGLIAPHAGYMYSGQVAAHAYQQIRGKKFDAVIVVGPSHRAYFHGVSVYNRGGYETPLGVVPVDASLADSIMEHSEIVSCDEAAHVQEHSVEIQLPFLQIALGEFKFVPLVMGDQSRQACELLAECIYQSIRNQNVLVVASSDLSHFHSYDKAIKIDQLLLSHVKNMDEQSLLRDLEDDRCEACGGGPMASTIMVSKKKGAENAALLKYANSGDVTGDNKSVVGYAAVGFYKNVL